MPDWLVVYFPLIVFVVLLPPVWLYNYRRYHRKKRERDAQRAGTSGPTTRSE
jgi:hypothetical protein